MQRYTWLIITMFLLTGFRTSSPNKATVVVSKEELKLYNLINEYRNSKGLPSIPLSKALTFVAQQHCQDLFQNMPDRGYCNLHSWSDKGNWSPCCYMPDHSQASCMWNKPRELTGYAGNGYEIACGSSNAYSDYALSAESALKIWQGSTGHNAVILNQGIWSNHSWRAVGVGIYKGFAMVWFGKSVDEQGEPQKAE